MAELHQSAFSFDVRVLNGRADFLTAPCNAEAVAMIDGFSKSGFYAGLIYGEKGCGKTHLSRLFAEVVHEKTGKQTAFLTKPDLIEAKYAVLKITLPVDETALFHCLNDFKNRNGYLLMTAESASAQWGLRLPDLITRLKAVPSVAIGEPDESLLNALLLKQFADRQLTVAPEVITYLTKNMERSFKAVSFIVKRADELSLERKNAITIPLIKQVLAEFR